MVESVVSHYNVMPPQYIFQRASIMAENLPSSIVLDQQAPLSLYAYLKQGSIGDTPDPRPAEAVPVELAKWEMWKELEGLDKVSAERLYVSILQAILQASAAPDTKQLLAQLNALSNIRLSKQP